MSLLPFFGCAERKVWDKSRIAGKYNLKALIYKRFSILGVTKV
ncbi:MAG: hypothetical protein QNJ68_07280 [Microcoleaceae cyanobacterium MO_207.B10]|nr:hypothetical protein [Microcoleaceae cyanobacterium MO_207.B10]